MCANLILFSDSVAADYACVYLCDCTSLYLVVGFYALGYFCCFLCLLAGCCCRLCTAENLLLFPDSVAAAGKHLTAGFTAVS